MKYSITKLLIVICFCCGVQGRKGSSRGLGYEKQSFCNCSNQCQPIHHQWKRKNNNIHRHQKLCLCLREINHLFYTKVMCFESAGSTHWIHSHSLNTCYFDCSFCATNLTNLNYISKRVFPNAIYSNVSHLKERISRFEAGVPAHQCISTSSSSCRPSAHSCSH